MDAEPKKEAPDWFDEIDEQCWNCGGEGYVYNCQDEIGCIDPEGGCDLCMRHCPICKPRMSKDDCPP